MTLVEEKEHYYYERTLEHIHRVQRNMFALLTDQPFRDLFDLTPGYAREIAHMVMVHDHSKFSLDQFWGYLDFSWAMKLRKDGEKAELSDKEQEAFDKAWKHHYLTENHHPERCEHAYKGTLSRWQAIECACDLQAMAQEFGTKAIDYFNDTWRSKQKDNFHSTEAFEDCCSTMYKCFKAFDRIEDELDAKDWTCGNCGTGGVVISELLRDSSDYFRCPDCASSDIDFP